MALLETGGKQFAIPVGDALLGSDPGSAVPLAGTAVLPRHAILQGQPDGQVVIRRAVPNAEVSINGVRVGAEPTPLLHGDKIEFGGHELTFVDERRSGSTQYIQAVKIESGEVVRVAAAPREGQSTAGTGGRIVCLTDGREYQVTGRSLVFGRDATSDVVVPGGNVSRRHAEILQTPSGYVIVDASTNGTFVNEQRLEGQRVLLRADIIRIGDEQFRFYADPAPTADRPPEPSAAPAPAAVAQLQDTVHGIPVHPGGLVSGPRPLARLLVKAGSNKGRRFDVRTPVANIGRAEYNDIVLPDPSVSTAHAKLQQREGVWVLIDLDSTNGTFVDGEVVKGEAALPPGASVRFGDVELAFDPGDDAVSVAKGGGTQVLRGADLVPPPPGPASGAAPPGPASPVAPPRPAARPAAAPRRGSPPARRGRPAAKAPEPKKGKGCGSGAAVLVLAMVTLIYWILV